MKDYMHVIEQLIAKATYKDLTVGSNRLDKVEIHAYKVVGT